LPRPFSDTEKATLRTRLIEAGRESFTRFGLAKTTIDDLARLAGIAKGSFYLLFDSKEALYIETVMAETPAVIERLLDASFRKTDDAREALVLLMKEIVREVETNPLSRVVFGAQSDVERLGVSMDVENLARDVATMSAPLVKEIRKAQRDGRIVKGDPQELLFVIGLGRVFPVNRGQLPEPLRTKMLDRAAQVIADGLTCPAESVRGGSR
jgi:AcrR family transcriptional regulator